MAAPPDSGAPRARLRVVAGVFNKLWRRRRRGGLQAPNLRRATTFFRRLNCRSNRIGQGCAPRRHLSGDDQHNDLLSSRTQLIYSGVKTYSLPLISVSQVLFST